MTVNRVNNNSNNAGLCVAGAAAVGAGAVALLCCGSKKE